MAYKKQQIDKYCNLCGNKFIGSSIKKYCSTACKCSAESERQHRKYHKNKKKFIKIYEENICFPNIKNDTIRKCKICNKVIKNNNLVYCSKECYKKSTLERAKRISKKLSKGYCDGKINGFCSICGEKYNKKNPTHLICSDKCREIKKEKINNLQWFEETKQDVKNYMKLRFECFKRDNFTCKYCGRNVKEDKIKIHLDHIIPRAKGGMDIPSNFNTSCEECNLGKRDVELSEVLIK